MKKHIAFILAVCLLPCSGCAIQNTDSVSETSKESTAVSLHDPPHTTTHSTETTVQTLPAVSPTAREILTELFIADGLNEELAQHEAEYMLKKAEQFTQRTLGAITSEEDAIAKTKTVLTEIGAADAIDMAESEYVELDGELVKYERNGPSYHVTYIEAADIWRVVPALPSGITEDGRTIGAPGMPPYVMLRGTDGYVLGIFV